MAYSSYWFDGRALQRRNGAMEERIEPWPPVASCRTRSSTATTGGYTAPPKDRRCSWTPTRPRLDLVRIDHLLRGHGPVLELFPGIVIGDEARAELSAWRQFRLRIPAQAWTSARRFRDGHYDLLRLFAHGRPALELAQTAPATAYLIAKDGGGDAARLLSMPQRRAVEALGLPGGRATARLLRKLSFDAIRAATLARLRSALKTDGVLTRLGHLPAVNAAVVALVSDPEHFAVTAPSFLAEVCEGDRNDVVFFLRDTLRMQQQLHPGRSIGVFDSVAAMRRQHDELTAELNKLQAIRGGFPAPPFPGVPGFVEPIINATELAAEGRQQQNCCASYAGSIRRGAVYLYRVLRPERATLSVQFTQRGWRIGELKKKCNAAVSDQTRLAVKMWKQGRSVRVGEASSAAVGARIDAAVGPHVGPAAGSARVTANGAAAGTAIRVAASRVAAPMVAADLPRDTPSTCDRLGDIPPPRCPVPLGKPTGGGLDRLIALLSDDDATARSGALIMLRLAVRDEPRVLTALSHALVDPEPSVRANAAEALGAASSEEALALLESVVGTERNARVRRAAATARHRLRKALGGKA